ncbi:MAG: response regulator [Pseudomonadota bacterium]
MDQRKRELLARLLATFKIEAAEHIEAITAGLVALECAGEGERAGLLERVFRAAHSLKGAARSVGLAGVEALCQELESVFAAWRGGQSVPSPEVLDAVHGALEVLAMSSAEPSQSPSPGLAEREREALAALRAVVRTSARASGPTPPGPAALSAPPPPDPTLPSPGPPPAAAPASPAADQVRVSAARLVALMQSAEEVVGARISAQARAEALGTLLSELAAFNRARARLGVRLRRSRDGAAEELIEAELLFTRALENKLRQEVHGVRQDAYALAAVGERLMDGTREALQLPCSQVLGTLPGVLRGLARARGKEAQLVVSGEDIEIDRRVLEALGDPLLHLVRNAVDHGIEEPDVREARGKPRRGTVTIHTRPVEGHRFELTVADDGAGIRRDAVAAAAERLDLMTPGGSLDDLDAAALVFQSGLTTAPVVTELSGRGLGLAIVREKVERLGGRVTVASEPGRGATFRMLLPVSLATFRGVFVACAGRRFVLPTSGVQRVGRLRAEEVRGVENRPTVAIAGRAVSVVGLADLLGLPHGAREPAGPLRPMVLVRAGERQVALLVDRVEGEQEVTAKRLGPQLVRVRNVMGACLTGSGALVPILNIADLVESAAGVGLAAPVPPAAEAAPAPRRRVLVAEDSITARMLVKAILEGAGYDVATAVDGMDALTRLKTEPFDLLVSDVDMPRLNGFELTSRVRAERKLQALPVVLVTALASQEDREYGIEVGADAYIVKSDFDQGDLIATLRRLL